MINNKFNSDAPENWDLIKTSLSSLQSKQLPSGLNERIFNSVNSAIDLKSKGNNKWLVSAISGLVLISSFTGWKLMSSDIKTPNEVIVVSSIQEKKSQKRFKYVKKFLPKPDMQNTENIVPYFETPEHIQPIDEKVKHENLTEPEVSTGGPSKK
ncbi:MAG: hypothetical protein IPP08_09600 [Chlorobiota bacterium]|jgi:hypothetical protein|nr:MAG: hypothetical protein IPP08_09600 [Chlorobiota bacterium]